MEDLSKLTVPQLKDKLKELSLPVSGAKAELIARLTEHLEKDKDAAEEEAKPAEDAEMKDASKEGEAETAKAEGDGEEVKGEEKDVEMKQEEEAKPPEPEEPKELEEDAPEDTRPRIAADAVEIGSPPDTTINVMPSRGGKVLMSLADSGFQHLVAAARCNTGVKTGRYLYEVRILENKQVMEPGKVKTKQTCTLGFTTADSSLMLATSADGVGFDSEGYCVSGGEWCKGRLFPRFAAYSRLYGVLLNLDPVSPNCHTVSLFCDGERLCKPQPLPESLKGKALFPTVNYRNMTLQVNFGPVSLSNMPFKCRMLQDAAAADVELRKPKSPAGGKREVLFPVTLPDEGSFEWLNGFLSKNPQYTELSNRSVLDWGVKSGLYRNRNTWQGCNDKPAMDFGIKEFDEYSLQTSIRSVAPMIPRDYVVMEVRGNLIAEERKKALAEFGADDFKRVAVVLMGEPPADFKAKVYEQLLEDKRAKVAREVRQKKVMELAEKKKAKKAEEEAAKQKAKEEAEAKAKEAKEAKEAGEGEESKEGDAEEKAEDKEEEAPAAEVKEEETKEDDTNEESAVEEAIREAQAAVTLTDEEKAQWFPKPQVEDIAKKDLGRCFGSFSIPAKEEGFDEVRFLWQKEATATEYLKAWINERKLTQRVEDLQPGERFRTLLDEWTAKLQEWRRRQNDRREPPKPAAAKKRKVEADKAAEAKEEEEKEENEEDAADGEKKDDGKEGEEAAEEEKKAEEEEEEEKAPEVTLEQVDPFLIQDVMDIGNGQPLFANFAWEDWAMLTFRFEVHHLIHSYRADVNDLERPSFHESLLGYYYQKYFKKNLSARSFGVNTNLELMELIKDTVEVASKCSILEPQLSDDTPLDNFVRLTEDHRRDRQRRYDAGDESAVLKIQRSAADNRGDNRGYNRGGGGGGRDYGRDNRGREQQGGNGRDRGGYQARGAPTPGAGYAQQPGYGGGARVGYAPPPPASADRDRRGGYGGGSGDARGSYDRARGGDARGRDDRSRDRRDSGYSRDAGRDGGGYPRDSRGGGYPSEPRGYDRRGGRSPPRGAPPPPHYGAYPPPMPGVPYGHPPPPPGYGGRSPYPPPPQGHPYPPPPGRGAPSAYGAPPPPRSGGGSGYGGSSGGGGYSRR